jgi:hypothetical protein
MSNSKKIVKVSELVKVLTETYGLSENEALEYTRRWMDVHAGHIKRGDLPAYVRPTPDGDLYIDIYGQFLLED